MNAIKRGAGFGYWIQDDDGIRNGTRKYPAILTRPTPYVWFVRSLGAGGPQNVPKNWHFCFIAGDIFP